MGCICSKEEPVLSDDVELSDGTSPKKKKATKSSPDELESNGKPKKGKGGKKKKKKKSGSEDMDGDDGNSDPEDAEEVDNSEIDAKKKKPKDSNRASATSFDEEANAGGNDDADDSAATKKPKKKKGAPPPPPSSDGHEDEVRGSVSESASKPKSVDILPGIPGKEGWLYRENEFEDSSSSKGFIRYWVRVAEFKFTYGLTQVTNENLEEGELHKGFFNLKLETSECKLRFQDKTGGKGVHASFPKGVGKFSFVLKDKDMGGIFSATSERERDEWMQVIKSAISGVKQVLARPAVQEQAVMVDAMAARQALSKSSLREPSMVAPPSGPPPSRQSMTMKGSENNVDMPRKLGPLKKKAMGGTLGYKSQKTRYFKLDGGELCYFVDEDMRPSKLKGHVILSNAKIVPQTDNKLIVLQLEDGSLLEMEAASSKLASEWIDVFRITINNLIGGAKVGKKRRVNLTNEGADTGSSNSAGGTNMTSRGSITGSFESRGSFTGASQPIDVAPVVISKQSRDIITNALKSHFLLSNISDFDPLIQALMFESVLPGDVIIHQGTKGDLFYILESGAGDVEKDGVAVGQVTGGKAFGELALLNNVARSATIRASQVCRLWTLDRKTFRSVLANQEKFAKEEKIAFLKTVKFFEQLSPSCIVRIADVLNIATFSANEKIIKQGEPGEKFYCIKSGKVSVTQSSFTSVKQLTTLAAGGYFGELALQSNEPRKATVTAMTNTVCWTMDRATFTSMLGNMKEAIDESIGTAILRNVKLLAGLNDKQLLIISRCLSKEEYEIGHVIITQGEPGDHFYMIASGEVTVQVNHVEVAKLGTGSFFGEKALLADDVRGATITACAKTVCLLLTRADFTRLLGPLDELIREESRRRTLAMKRESDPVNKAKNFFGSFFGGPMDETEQQDQTDPKRIEALKKADPAAAAASAESLRQKMMKQANAVGLDLLIRFGAQYQLNQFAPVQVLYDGVFSCVKLVQHTKSAKTFALKIFKKQSLLENNLERAPFSEKETLCIFDFPFIAGCYATFRDDNALYFLMELLPGGDFWSLLYGGGVELKKNPENSHCLGLVLKDAWFYIINVITILLFIHEKDVAYRDLKPENLVIDATGYLKLVDFGNAKYLPAPNMTNTMCGSPEYVAPEMVLARDHNHSVDYWSLGILVYEILTRSTPFEHDNASLIYQNIIDSDEMLKKNFASKLDFNPDAKDFICKLLTPKPSIRFGMLRNGTADIWNHPFIAKSGYTAEKVMRRDMKPPYVPNITSATDCFNFEEYDDTDVPMRKYTGRFDFKNF